MDLADYRAAWLGGAGARLPAQGRRPGPTRRGARGLGPAVRTSSTSADGPRPRPRTTGARSTTPPASNALCCAYAALRLGRSGEHALLGAAGHGRAVVPADANLRDRIDLTLERLRREGSIRI